MPSPRAIELRLAHEMQIVEGHQRRLRAACRRLQRLRAIATSGDGAANEPASAIEVRGDGPDANDTDGDAGRVR